MGFDIGSVAGNIAQTAGGTLFGNLINQAFAGKNARMNWKYQKKAADYTYEKDLQMWNTMNEYNTPASQMARLEAAGLNPAMMYGTGQGANVAKEMPKYNNPNVSWDAPIINPFQVMSAYADLKVKNAQVDNINAQTETRRLENNLRSGTLLKQIDKMAWETENAKWKSQLEYLKWLIENQFQDIGTYADKTPENERFAGTRKKLGELEITQQAARRTRAEADLKDQEAGIYRALKDYFGNTTRAGYWAKILSVMLNKL